MTFGTYKHEALSTRFDTAKFDVLKGNTFCRFDVTYFCVFEGSTLPFISIPEIRITWNAVIDIDILLIVFVLISVWYEKRGLHRNTHTHITNQIHSWLSRQGTYTANVNNNFLRHIHVDRKSYFSISSLSKYSISSSLIISGPLKARLLEILISLPFTFRWYRPHDLFL